MPFSSEERDFGKVSSSRGAGRNSPTPHSEKRNIFPPAGGQLVDKMVVSLVDSNLEKSSKTDDHKKR
jgi:hypothetical protein